MCGVSLTHLLTFPFLKIFIIKIKKKISRIFGPEMQVAFSCLSSCTEVAIRGFVRLQQMTPLASLLQIPEPLRQRIKEIGLYLGAQKFKKV